MPKLIAERRIGDARHLHGAIETMIQIGKVKLTEPIIIKVFENDNGAPASVARLFQEEGKREFELHIL